MRTIDELYETALDSPDYWRDPYQLHQILGWKPWEPFPAAVWANKEPTEIWENRWHDWPRLRAQLEALHAEYLKRKGET